MHDSVRAAFVAFSSKHEGVLYAMYADIKSLITTGIGNLIDPIDSALSVPFVRADGTPAGRAEIAAEWRAVKAGSCGATGDTSDQCLWLGRKNPENGNPCFAHQGWRASAPFTKLRLTPAGLERLVLGKLDSNESELRHRFPAWDSWPADAQLATHSMAWACGSRFRFPKLASALNALDFDASSVHCHIREAGNPGIVGRNIANKAMYRNAAAVVAMKLDPTELHYPKAVPVAPDSTPTLEVAVPSRRPPRIDDFAIVHPTVPLGRPALDGELPTTPLYDLETDPDDEPPKAA